MCKLLSLAMTDSGIKKKIFITIGLIFLMRIGSLISVPGIHLEMFQGSDNNLLYNILSSGAISTLSIFTLGIGPFITASIVIQLLTIIIPKLREISKDGNDGKKRIKKYTTIIALNIAVLQSIGTVLRYKWLMIEPNEFIIILDIVLLVVGTGILIWFSEIITKKGLCNGTSIIILSNIISGLPSGINYIYQLVSNAGHIGVIKVGIMLSVMIITLYFVVIIQDGERKIHVQYSSKIQGKTQDNILPVKVNASGVMSIIFAISLIQLPAVIGQFIQPSGNISKIIGYLDLNNPIGATLYIMMIMFFSYFYTSVTFNTTDIAENLKKSGGVINGIRPGTSTVKYINDIVSNVTFVGAVCYSIIAFIPILLQWVLNINVSFGGTTLIIVTGVSLEIIKNLKAQLLNVSYANFLD